MTHLTGKYREKGMHSKSLLNSWSDFFLSFCVSPTEEQAYLDSTLSFHNLFSPFFLLSEKQSIFCSVLHCHSLCCLPIFVALYADA